MVRNGFRNHPRIHSMGMSQYQATRKWTAGFRPWFHCPRRTPIGNPQLPTSSPPATSEFVATCCAFWQTTLSIIPIPSLKRECSNETCPFWRVVAKPPLPCQRRPSPYPVSFLTASRGGGFPLVSQESLPKSRYSTAMVGPSLRLPNCRHCQGTLLLGSEQRFAAWQSRACLF